MPPGAGRPRPVPAGNDGVFRRDRSPVKPTPENKMKTPPRIVIVGAAGRLGQALERRFSREMEVIGMTRPGIDLASAESIAAALGPLDFDFLILPAAMTAVDPCESRQAEAYAINAAAPGQIAAICAEKGAHMTYVSTDFVFEGTKAGAYTEEDSARPVSVYGASKLKGEEVVLAAAEDNLVVRVSWLYGPGKPAFPEWIVEKACAESTLLLPADKSGCPTSSVDVAEMLVSLLIGGERSPARGIYHLCNSGGCTWAEWGQACIDLAREAGAPVRAETVSGNSLADIAAFLAKRPANSVLSNSKFAARTGVTPRPWRDALREHFQTSDSFKKFKAATCG